MYYSTRGRIKDVYLKYTTLQKSVIYQFSLARIYNNNFLVSLSGHSMSNCTLTRCFVSSCHCFLYFLRTGQSLIKEYKSETSSVFKGYF